MTTVLIVDDNPDDQKMMADILNKEGYKSVSAMKYLDDHIGEAAVIDFNAEKDQPWEYFVKRGQYKEATRG